MGKHFAAPINHLLAGTPGPVHLIDPVFAGGKVHALCKTVDLAESDVNSGDVIVWDVLPKGAVPLAMAFLASASMGATATLDVGSAATPAKYRAAATFTTANAPVLFGKAGALGVATDAAETLQSVIAAADLPAIGTLTFIALYTLPDGA